MRIVMTTCARTPSFLNATLRSLFASDFPRDQILQLSVHEPNLSCVENWLGHPQIHVRDLLPEEARDKQGLALKARIVHATKIALDLAPGPVLLLQDDVEFAPNWWARFCEVLAGDRPRVLKTGEPFPLERCMIALYSHLDGHPGVRAWAPATWWGLQACYFGEEARRLAISSLALRPNDWFAKRVSGADVRIQEGLGVGHVSADDVRIRDALLGRHHGVMLIGIWPSLCQHTGRASSIGSPDHRSPTFGNKGLCDPVRFR